MTTGTEGLHFTTTPNQLQLVCSALESRHFDLHLGRDRGSETREFRKQQMRV